MFERCRSLHAVVQGDDCSMVTSLDAGRRCRRYVVCGQMAGRPSLHVCWPLGAVTLEQL